MAEGKNKIIVYRDWKDLFLSLKDNQAGKLIKHFFRYVNDEKPKELTGTEKIAWISIQATLKRDLKKWENFVEKQADNGKKGGRPVNNKLYSKTGKLIPDNTDKHFVYLIFDSVKLEFKIGETQNLIKRRYTIKRPTNDLIIWDFAILDPYTCQEIERNIKNKYKHNGDWLDITEKDANDIIELFSQKTQAFDKIPKKAVSDSVIIDSVIIEKEIKNNIENRKLSFASTLKPFLEKYGKETLNDFYKYWTEPNRSGTKFKMEMEKTWSLELRLSTWASNESKFGKKEENKPQPKVTSGISFATK